MPDYLSDTLVSVGESVKAPRSKSLTEPRAAAARAFLKAALERRGVNQVAYAKLTGVSQSQINDFLNENTQGGFALIEAIADAERVSIDAVVGRSVATAVPATVKEKAAFAARLLGYAPDVIEAGVLQATEDEDARSILRHIQKIDAAPPAAAEDKERLGRLPQDPAAILAAAAADKPATSGG